MNAEHRGGMAAHMVSYPNMPEPLLNLPANRSVYVVGGPDTGKTTFSSTLYRRWLELGKAGYLDCDCGQSSIAEPATLALQEQIAPDASPRLLRRFIGSTSPAGHLLPMLTSIRRLWDAATAERLVIDSSGFLEDPAAIEFQINLIDCIRPAVIVALGRNQAVGAVLSPFRNESGIETLRLEVPDAVRAKPVPQRRDHRRQRFAAYFSAARRQQLPLDRVGVYGRVPNFLRPGSVTYRLCGLCAEGQFLDALAIALAYDATAKALTVLTPTRSLDAVVAVRFGALTVTPDGEER